MVCAVCKVDFEAKRADAKYCSPKCRKEASRISSVTDNVTLSDPAVTDNLLFKFTTKYSHGNNRQTDVEQAYQKERTALYWYDVPLSALPVIQKGWPQMPEFMNGRQYFLWWKNEFEMKDGSPVILNPFKIHDKVEYVKAGEQSRIWGAH